MKIIGVDIGTTHTKAVVTDSSGKVLTEAKASYPTLNPLPGYSEQDPDQVLQAVLSALQQAFLTIDDRSLIEAVCFSAAMHSIMAVDSDGRPLTNLYTWADTRSRKQAKRLKGTELGRRIYESTGTAVHPMSPLCKIAWIREEQPLVFKAAAKFISLKEYLFFTLFGTYVVDVSIASATGLFDYASLNWHPEALAFAGISERNLSQPVPTTFAPHELLEKYRLLFGLSKPVPFFVGASDGCLAIIGSGATSGDEAALTIGTSGAIRKITNKPLRDAHGRLFNYVLDNDWFVSGGASNNGGVVLKWFAENMMDRQFNSAESFNWFMSSAAGVPAGADGLIFLPYIQGERSPVWDADARGVFFGVTNHHRSSHFMRAILEGVSFSLYQIMQAMEESGGSISVVYASGGFIESPFWLQLVADVLNKKIIVSHAADASAMGAIFVAMSALGYIKEWREVKDRVVTSAEYHPEPASHLIYRKNFEVFQTLYPNLEDSFTRMAGGT